MPSRFRLRRLFRRRPIVRTLAKLADKAGMTPNLVTLLTPAAAAFPCILYILSGNIPVMGLGIFIITILDGVDGTLARMTGRVSRFGGILDSVCDRIVEALFYMSLLIRPAVPVGSFPGGLKLYIFLIFMAILGSIMISYTRSVASAVEKKGDYDIGLFARSERLVFLSVTVLSAAIPTAGYCIFISMFFILISGIWGTFLFRLFKFSSYLRRNR